jgi:hypothetical protein
MATAAATAATTAAAAVQILLCHARSVKACPPQGHLDAKPTCDDLLAQLNNTVDCVQLELAFALNCTGCACGAPVTMEATTAVPGRVEGIMWTLVAMAAFFISVVVAVLIHKMQANAVVVPQNQRRPLTGLEMQLERKNRSMRRLLALEESSHAPASSALVQVCTHVARARLDVCAAHGGESIKSVACIRSCASARRQHACAHA